MKKQAKDELEEMFEDLGELEDVRALMRKKLLADALRKAMKAQKVTPAEMARRMKTSRPTVYRLLDPAEPGATLDTLARASVAVGLDLEIRLVPRRRPVGRRARRRSRRPELAPAGPSTRDRQSQTGPSHLPPRATAPGVEPARLKWPKSQVSQRLAGPSATWEILRRGSRGRLGSR